MSNPVKSHEFDATAHYLGNEGIMVTDGTNKVLFDPFFHNNYQTYSLVPDVIRQAIFSGTPPYNDIDILFISHAHGDHFSAKDVVSFLNAHQKTHLVAPKQAVNAVMKLAINQDLKERISSIELAFGDSEKKFKLKGIDVEAIRIPHAGWPARKKIENIIYRLTLKDDVRIMHMGDADSNKNHFLPYNSLWQKKTTNTVFPPYWFLLSSSGNNILNNIIKAKQTIGIHVPTIVPQELKETEHDYFSISGETRELSKHTPKTPANNQK